MSFPGKVRRRACGQHTSAPKNVRMRGKSCPKAWVSPEPERVCPKVGAKPHKSCFSSPGRKSRSVEAPLRTPRALAGGVFSLDSCYQRILACYAMYEQRRVTQDGKSVRVGQRQRY